MGRHRLVEPQGRVPVPRPAKQRNNLSASPLVSGTVRLFYMSNFQKTVRIMENPQIFKHRLYSRHFGKDLSEPTMLHY